MTPATMRTTTVAVLEIPRKVFLLLGDLPPLSSHRMAELYSIVHESVSLSSHCGQHDGDLISSPLPWPHHPHPLVPRHLEHDDVEHAGAVESVNVIVPVRLSEYEPPPTSVSITVYLYVSLDAIETNGDETVCVYSAPRVSMSTMTCVI
eukprot:Amastigsp_a841521_495.p2 type:complete len:149 gc:universal Amastigsp_a841521_495:824-378(-)